jgi:hypothetical protein
VEELVERANRTAHSLQVSGPSIVLRTRGNTVASGSWAGGDGFLQTKAHSLSSSSQLDVVVHCSQPNSVHPLLCCRVLHLGVVCTCVQVEYHQEKFRAFPHINSPARLIKEIVKPPAKRVQQQQ